MYKCDLRTSSTVALDRPMSASIRSSSSRSSPYWPRRSHLRAIPSSHASGIFQDHPGPGRRVKLLRECWLNAECCRKTCFTSVMERNNAWLRELIGRLSTARVTFLSRPPLVFKRTASRHPHGKAPCGLPHLTVAGLILLTLRAGSLVECRAKSASKFQCIVIGPEVPGNTAAAALPACGYGRRLRRCRSFVRP